MVDKKISGLPENTAPVSTDFLVMVDDPSGTPITKKSLISNVVGHLVTTAGDIIYATASRVLARLAIGTAGQVLTVNSGATAPEWVTILGKHTVDIPASAIRPTSSNGCATLVSVETTAGRPDMNVLDFDKDADEHAQFSLAFPKSWNEGTITFKVFWTNVSAVTTGVAWGLQGVAVSDNDTIDVAYGTPIVVTDDSLNAAEDLMVTVESAAVTIAGTPAESDNCFFRIFRDIDDGNDDLAEDARLIKIQVFWTADALNDD